MPLKYPVTATDVGTNSRTVRRPRHTWHLRVEPWEIQPCMIAPVLPGETMRNLLFQVRCVTDPLKNPLIGWHLEYYFFYVKHRDLAESEHYQNMVLQQGYSGFTLATSKPRYFQYADVTNNSAIPWVEECMKAIINHYFRDEGNDAADYVSTAGMPMASFMQEGWMDSLTLSANAPMEDDAINVDLDTDTNITTREIELAMRQYEFLKAHQMTNMSYEDFLRSYGVRTQLAQQNVPELIRYVRQFQYPSNTINPADGAPSSAVSWSLAERADKDRYFSEPGFVIGCQVVRPKVYMRQWGNVSQWLNDAFSWLPAMLQNDSGVAWKRFNGDDENADTGATADGPLRNNADGYWVDMRDLFLYGDEFVNFDPDVATTTDAGLIAVPNSSGRARYPSGSEQRALFVDSAGTDFLVRSDGIANMAIATQQRDQSGRTIHSV